MATALAIGGALFSGVAGASNEAYQASVAQRNAAIAGINAQQALEKGQQDAKDNDFRTSAQLGQLINNEGGSGLSLSSRSRAAVARSARIIGEMGSDRAVQAGLNTGANWRNQQQGYETEAANHTAGIFTNLIGGAIGAGNAFFKQTSLVGGAQASTRFTSSPGSLDRSSILGM